MAFRFSQHCLVRVLMLKSQGKQVNKQKNSNNNKTDSIIRKLSVVMSRDVRTVNTSFSK